MDDINGEDTKEKSFDDLFYSGCNSNCADVSP